MAWALCLHCGNLRGGALAPCDNCGGETSGDFELDQLFGEPRLPRAALTKFSMLIKQLHQRIPEKRLAMWIFLLHVDKEYPTLLRADPPPDIDEKARDLLERLNLPPLQLIRWYESRRQWWKFWLKGRRRPLRVGHSAQGKPRSAA